MKEIVDNADIHELKIILSICGLIIGLLVSVVGFFIIKGISKSAKSLESMAGDIGQIKLTVMRVETKHDELEKRVVNLEQNKHRSL